MFPFTCKLFHLIWSLSQVAYILYRDQVDEKLNTWREMKLTDRPSVCVRGGQVLLIFLFFPTVPSHSSSLQRGFLPVINNLRQCKYIISGTYLIPHLFKENIQEARADPKFFMICPRTPFPFYCLLIPTWK